MSDYGQLAGVLGRAYPKIQEGAHGLASPLRIEVGKAQTKVCSQQIFISKYLQ